MKRLNSTINIKCKCGAPDCDRMPTFSCYGYNYAHLPEDLKEKAGTRAKVAVKNRNKRVAIGRKLHIAQNKANGNEEKSALWFISKRHQMIGWCACGCGEMSSKDNDEYWKFSAAHILSKAKFKSIAWHPDNWVELAFWGGCHTIFDDKEYEYCKTTKPILWDIVVEKFKILYPCIAVEELKHLPEVLLKELITKPVEQ